MIHPPVEYFPQIREMTARLGVLWLDDEVMTGFGRLGEWFGYDVYRVTPDIMAVAKGLVSSALPASAVILSKELSTFFDKWRFETMSTFGSHPLPALGLLRCLRPKEADRCADDCLRA